MITQHRMLVAALTVAVGAFTAGALAAQAPAPGAATRPAAAAQARSERGERAESGDQERGIVAARVPAAVREGVHRTYPNAIVTKWAAEVENGRTVYEAETRDGTTRRDMLVGTDGTILETETQVASDQLPAAVRAAAEANRARIRLAERVVVGHDTTYEIQVQGRRGALALLPTGQPVPAAPRRP